MKINIGIPIELQKFLETRGLILADSGAGKSWLIRKMAEECSGKVQQIIIDPEGEFVTLREKYPFALVCKRGGDLPLDVRYAEMLAHKILETGISVIIDLYELKQAERELFVKAFTEALVDAPKNIRRSCIVYYDEAQLFCPEDKRAVSYHSIIDICTRGRKRGLCPVLATHRTSVLSKSAAAQCKNKLIGSTSLPLDQKRVADELGLYDKDEIRGLRNLDPGQFYAFGNAISKEIVLFNVGDVKTTHIESGKKLKTIPPTPAAIKKILSKLESIPEEAEEELKSKKEMSDKIRSLQYELKLAQKQKTVVQPAILPDPKLNQKISVLTSERDHARSETIIWKKAAETYKKSVDDIVAIVSKLSHVKIDFSKLPKLPVEKMPTHEKGSPVANQLRSAGIPPMNDGKLTVAKSSAAAVALSKHPLNKDADTKSLPVGEQSVLTACAQFPNGLRRDQITVITGYKRSTRDRYLQYLKEKGLVKQDSERLVPTEAGLATLGDDYEPLPTGEALQRYWLNKLPQGEKAILECLISAYPNAVSREDLTASTGYKRSTRDRYLQYMASKEIVINIGRGEVKASDNLF